MNQNGQVRAIKRNILFKDQVSNALLFTTNDANPIKKVDFTDPTAFTTKDAKSP